VAIGLDSGRRFAEDAVGMFDTRFAFTWTGLDAARMEYVDVRVGPGPANDGLVANGMQIGVEPEPYSVRYQLIVDAAGITRQFAATSRTMRWSRRVTVERNQGGYTVGRESVGMSPDQDPGELPFDALDGALDVDLGYSPLFNSTPVLRDRLVDEGAEARDYLMAWVSVPELTVTPSRQRYEPLGRDGDFAVVRYSNLDSDFTARIWFDADGFVAEYEDFLRRVAEGRHGSETEPA
jgi:hypothetical protein